MAGRHCKPCSCGCSTCLHRANWHAIRSRQGGFRQHRLLECLLGYPGYWRRSDKVLASVRDLLELPSRHHRRPGGRALGHSHGAAVRNKAWPTGKAHLRTPAHPRLGFDIRWPYDTAPENVRLFWGVAEYNDVLPNTARHIAKPCYRLIADEQAITDTVDDRGFPKFVKGPNVIPCAHHRCTGEECDYDCWIVPDPNASRPAKPPNWLSPSRQHMDP